MADELLYEIEIVRNANRFVATISSRKKPIRERKSRSFEELLERIGKEIQEENEDR